MLTKEQLQAGAKAIEKYTDSIVAQIKRRSPQVADSVEFSAAMMICISIQAALQAMADAAPKQEDRT